MNKYQNELLQDAIDKLSELIGSRGTVAPEDYPPSYWKEYKQETEEIQHVRADVELLFNHLNDH